MKFFQQLLVAPAALGLLATGANAAELNINGVSDYAASADQVTSVTQFSDVYPTDWAYQALAGLVETYGCVAGYPNGTFRGNRAMTRFEAAALLNACLDRVTEVTDELRRLMAEFETELAILKGRVDGLEARVGELEASQFSTTTKLKGVANFFVGAVDMDEAEKGMGEEVFMQYRYRLNLNTSFTGKDLLYARLQAADGKGDHWETGDTHLNASGSNGSAISVDKLWYTFPVGSFKFTIGPKIENYYMVETPTRYNAVLKALKLGGYGAVMGASTGAGAGIQWRQDVNPGEPAFNFAINYTSNTGDHSAEDKGIFGENAGSSMLTQVGYGTRKWWIGASYALKNDYGKWIAGQSTLGTVEGDLNAWGLRGFWTPEESGIIPSISAGIDFGSADAKNDGATTETFGYMVGLNWDNVFVDGNKAGVGFGSIGSYITDTKGSANVDRDNSALEVWYDYQVTDNISVKPAVFWTNNYDSDADDKFGAVVTTTFKF
ncbi:iron uptake porin [Synechococcus sp. N19]|uniref:iron uptake porin n=1 Tax=Synechococcus sp. N19 TaxID=2575512 RepID=UPI000E0EAC0E|nr:iron uptake porin [Synechococcus sp. N19]